VVSLLTDIAAFLVTLSGHMTRVLHSMRTTHSAANSLHARYACPIAPGRTIMSSTLSEPRRSTAANRVHRDADKVWIDGVEGFGSCEFASSVHGVQARICQIIGEPLTYEQLLCYGGLGFRVQVHDAMCPSAGHPCCGFVCIENSNRALPWRKTYYESFPWSP